MSCFPADDICDYFGVKIAMYFAWLGFYTTSMLYPAVIGFVLWMLTESDQVRRTDAAGEIHFTSSSRGESEACALLGPFQTSRDICCVVFALFNVVWATLFLERWKRKGAELAYKWGTLDTPAESLEEPRPQFRVWEKNRKNLTFFPSVFHLDIIPVVSWPSAGSEALQSHNGM